MCADEDDDKKTKLKMLVDIVGRWQVDIWSGMSGKMHCFQCFLQQSYICPGSITFSSFKANKNQRENRNFVNEKLPLGNDCTINYDVSLHATYFTALHNHIT